MTGSVIGGMISPAEALARAQYWTTHPPPTGYDQSNSTPDPDGKFYRSDCSGFVSMCWHLPSSLTTADIGGGAALQIDPADLQPGDAVCASSALNGGSGHVVLFDHWISGHSSYFGHEFGGGSAPLHHEIPYPYFSNDSRMYRAYHYPNLGGSYVPPPYAPGSPPYDPAGGGVPAVIGIPTVAVYTTPGVHTWTKPATGTWVTVYAAGGSGAGGNGGTTRWYTGQGPPPTNYVGGGGGGGGAYVIRTGQLDSVNETVTLGVGAGAYSGGNLDGEPSSFGLVVFAGGGGTGGDHGSPFALGHGLGGYGGPAGGNYTGWTGVGYPGAPGTPGTAPDLHGVGGVSGTAGQNLPFDMKVVAPGTDGKDNTWVYNELSMAENGSLPGAPGWVVVVTGGDRPAVGGDFSPGDNGNTPKTGGSSLIPPQQYLRMTQRDDGRGIEKHPRLQVPGANEASSKQSKSIRLGETNTYR